jgi:hypothetical protein
MRTLLMLFVAAVCAWASPVVVTEETSVSCTGGGVTVTNPRECFAGSGTMDPLGSSRADAQAYSRYEADPDGTFYAEVSTGAGAFHDLLGSASASSHLNMIVNLTTQGPAREGRIDLAVYSDLESSRAYLKGPGAVDFSSEYWTRSEDFRVPVIIGQPFQIEMDSLTVMGGEQGGSGGGYISFTATAWEHIIETEFGQSYLTWHQVPISLYDPATATPEPGSVVLFGSAIMALAFERKVIRLRRL